MTRHVVTSLAMTLALTLLALPSAASAETSNQETLEAIRAKAVPVVKNGAAWMSRYDVQNFNLGKETSRIRKDLPEAPCSFDLKVGRREAIQLLRDESINEDPSIADDVETLHKNGQLKTIITANWADGEAEACSITLFAIYTIDGYVLSLEFNETD